MRSYRQGDEVALSEMSNRVARGHPGRVHKTADHWRWCFAQRPEVSADGIFVAHEDDAVAGYAVVGKNGVVYDLCIAPNARAARVLDVLLDEVERYAVRSGASRISLALAADAELRRRLERRGYGPWMRRMTVFPGDLTGFLSALLAANGEADGKPWMLEVRRPRRRMRGVDAQPVCLEVRGRSLQPCAASARPPVELWITVDLLSLLELIFRRTGLVGALLRRRLTVRPWRRVWRAMAVLRGLRLPEPWHTPMADMI